MSRKEAASGEVLPAIDRSIPPWAGLIAVALAGVSAYSLFADENKEPDFSDVVIRTGGYLLVGVALFVASAVQRSRGRSYRAVAR